MSVFLDPRVQFASSNMTEIVSYSEPIQSGPYLHPISIRYILIVFFNLCLGFSNGLFP
jgi:hypothetical protein